jgi:hypothetical protein
MEGPNHYNVWHMLMEDQTGLFRAMQARQPCDGLPNLICAGNASMRCALLSVVSGHSSSFIRHEWIVSFASDSAVKRRSEWVCVPHFGTLRSSRSLPC